MKNNTQQEWTTVVVKGNGRTDRISRDVIELKESLEGKHWYKNHTSVIGKAFKKLKGKKGKVVAVFDGSYLDRLYLVSLE